MTWACLSTHDWFVHVMGSRETRCDVGGLDETKGGAAGTSWAMTSCRHFGWHDGAEGGWVVGHQGRCQASGLLVWCSCGVILLSVPEVPGRSPCGYLTSSPRAVLHCSRPGIEQRHSLQYGNRQFAQHPQRRPFPLGAAVDKLRQLLFYFFQPFPKTTKIHHSNLLRRLHRQSSNFEPQRHAALKKKTTQTDSDIEVATRYTESLAGSPRGPCTAFLAARGAFPSSIG